MEQTLARKLIIQGLPVAQKTLERGVSEEVMALLYNHIIRNV